MHRARLKSAMRCACLMNHVVIAFSPMQKGSSLYPNTSRKTDAFFRKIMHQNMPLWEMDFKRDGGQLQQHRLIHYMYCQP